MNLDTKLAELEQQERIAIANVQRIQGAIAIVKQLQEEQDAEARPEGQPAQAKAETQVEYNACQSAQAGKDRGHD